MTSPRERELEARLTALLMATRHALRDWRQIKPRMRLRGTMEETQAWLRDDVRQQAAAGARSPYRDD